MEEASPSQWSNGTTTKYCTKVNKWTHGIRVLQLCGFKSLLINTYNGMMLPKNHNTIYPLVSATRQVRPCALLPQRSSIHCWYTKRVAYHQVESNRIQVTKSLWRQALSFDPANSIHVVKEKHWNCMQNERGVCHCSVSVDFVSTKLDSVSMSKS